MKPIRIRFRGVTRTLQEWCSLLHVNYSRAWERHHDGLTPARIFNPERRGTKHGLYSKYRKTFHVWQQMHQRCVNPKNEQYCNYGARGIHVCQRWKSFKSFIDDMGPCPSGLSIERKNVNGNYTPSNCVWIPKEHQARNRRDTHPITHKGITLPRQAWAKRFGINPETFRGRLNAGYSFTEAIRQQL